MGASPLLRGTCCMSSRASRRLGGVFSSAVPTSVALSDAGRTALRGRLRRDVDPVDPRNGDAPAGMPSERLGGRGGFLVVRGRSGGSAFFSEPIIMRLAARALNNKCVAALAPAHALAAAAAAVLVLLLVGSASPSDETETRRACPGYSCCSTTGYPARGLQTSPGMLGGRRLGSLSSTIEGAVALKLASEQLPSNGR
eukprot:329569-Chlamydomonas_euryale.AAC.1